MKNGCKFAPVNRSITNPSKTKAMKRQEKINKAFEYFKKPYAYKMGGTQTVVLPNGKSKHFDDREYYSGRGVKYNSSIRHDAIGLVKVSRKEYSEFLAEMREREERARQWAANEADRIKRIEAAKAKGLYSIKDIGWGLKIELSDEECYGKHFDADRLARTLDISVSDAMLLRSEGKTYVFAKKSNGEFIELYHPATSCNDLHITVHTHDPERMAKFQAERAEWENAPFAHMVGQSSAQNHYVC